MERNTRQRAAVREVLETSGRPLTVAEIHDRASARAPGLGLRTVYRHLAELAAAREIVGLDYPGQPPRYELPNRSGHHAHLVCRGCGGLFDLPGEPKVVFSAPQGFVVTGEEVVFYGSCPACAGRLA